MKNSVTALLEEKRGKMESILMVNVQCSMLLKLLLMYCIGEHSDMSMHSIYALLFAWFPTILFFFSFELFSIIVCAIQTANNTWKIEKKLGIV